jgi:YVTN family beta-propeller protein
MLPDNDGLSPGCPASPGSDDGSRDSGKTAYVANYMSNTVTPINTAPNTALPPIPADSMPDAIAVTP